MGIKDQGLSECLQLDPALTLEKAKTLSQQQEAIHKQQAILTSSSSQLSSSPIDAVKHQSRNLSASGQSKNCSRCGRGHHSKTCDQPRMQHVMIVRRRREAPGSKRAEEAYKNTVWSRSKVFESPGLGALCKFVT